MFHMKTKLLLVMLLAISFLMCKKESLLSGYWGSASVEMNGTFLEANTRANSNRPHDQGIDVHVDFFDESIARHGSIFLYKIPKAEGEYKLSNTEVRTIDSLSGAFFATTIGGDVLADTYDLLEGSEENRLILEKIDGDELWGAFQVSFVKDTSHGQGDINSPDTVIFANGQFHTKILD